MVSCYQLPSLYFTKMHLYHFMLHSDTCIENKLLWHLRTKTNNNQDLITKLLYIHTYIHISLPAALTAEWTIQKLHTQLMNIKLSAELRNKRSD